jgi:large subunit ribosomal protein L25
MAAQTRPRIAAEHRPSGARKSELKTLRRTGRIPAVVFGHGDPEPVAIDAREFTDFLHHHAAGGMIDLAIDKGMSPALIREFDLDPLTGRVIHLGFQRVNLNERIKATIPLMFTGEEEILKRELVLQRQMSEVEVHAQAGALPEYITIELAGVEVGHAIRLADLSFPKGVEPTGDPEMAVASITLPSVPADIEAALDAEEAAHAELEAAHATEAEADAEEEGEVAEATA